MEFIYFDELAPFTEEQFRLILERIKCHMTEPELMLVLQAILMSSYSKRKEAEELIRRELRLKNLDPRKGGD